MPKTMKKLKVKKESITRLKLRADALFSQIIRLRDGKCLRCGTTKNLQCSHVINRDHMAHRWDKKSAMTLCYGCHLQWWHKEPLEVHKWLSENYPDFYSYYWKHRGDILSEPIDYKSLLKKLNEELEVLNEI